MTHRIADVHFVHGEPSDTAPLWCECGWRGTAAEFAGHRSSVGARYTSGNALGPRNAEDPFRQRAVR